MTVDRAEDRETGTPHRFDPATFLRELTTLPGVYRMVGASGDILYVGKARNLKRRVSSYFQRGADSPKTAALVAQVRDVQVTVTRTEDEALVLESNLIKAHRPRYNVVLRDDKSYPFLFVSGNHPFPRLGFHRGTRRIEGRYFGPYPNAGAVREMQETLHKLFRIRQCDDSFFANRSRPCLQYQIKRCTAPCVGLISESDYRRDVDNVMRLLEGRAEEIMKDLAAEMEQAAEQLEYERAARLREQIALIRRLQDQPLAVGAERDFDVCGAAVKQGVACVAVMSIRNGVNFGDRAFFPDIPDETNATDVLSAFLSQHYTTYDPPPGILVDTEPVDREWLERTLSARAGRRVRIVVKPRGPRARLMSSLRNTIRQTLTARLLQRTGVEDKLESLQEALDLAAIPRHIECVDISHTGGERAVASCVVFVEGKPEKASYRTFNIDGVEPGDDYAAIRQAISRRFLRIKRGESRMPGLLIIDGGMGQVTQAMEALRELGIDDLPLLGVAKGPTRKPGLEQIVLPGRKSPLILRTDSPALHLIQQIRDEAHRFAVGGHRRRRDKARTQSVLDGIPGLGAARRRHLLKTFGGAAQIARTGVDELARTEGISRALAQRIYDHFHDEG
jgi:excinuclease ABC subunit C